MQAWRYRPLLVRLQACLRPWRRSGAQRRQQRQTKMHRLGRCLLVQLRPQLAGALLPLPLLPLPLRGHRWVGSDSRLLAWVAWDQPPHLSLHLSLQARPRAVVQQRCLAWRGPRMAAAAARVAGPRLHPQPPMQPLLQLMQSQQREQQHLQPP